jgi:hypothetical protein
MIHVLAVGSWLIVPSLAVAQPSGPKHLEAARDFVKNLSLGDTDYRHKDTVVRWKGFDGATRNEARTDCSGFIDELLAHTYGLTRDDFKNWTGRPRPLANTYYEVIDQGKRFTKVVKVAEIRAGDIIAIHYPAGAADTGHVMLVTSVPARRIASAPLLAGTEQWEIKIIDCSRSGHGKTDTRHRADGTFAGGVGEGVFRLYTDSSGQFVGYAWSTAAKSDYRGRAERPVAVGRLDMKFNR